MSYVKSFQVIHSKVKARKALRWESCKKAPEAIIQPVTEAPIKINQKRKGG